MLVKVGIRLEIQVVQLQIMEKQMLFFAQLTIITFSWVYIEVLQLSDYFMKLKFKHSLDLHLIVSWC